MNLRVLTTIGKLLSVVAGLSAYADVIPAKYALVAAIAFAVASTLKDTVRVIGDLLDDGKKNDSFKLD